MKKIFLILSMCTLLFTTNSIFATENSSKVSLGASLNDKQKEETLTVLNETDIDSKNVISIDGKMIDKYLKDGSNNDTDIYSSSKVDFKKEGYGVHVQILTPENITEVSESAYKNAAIAAGAKNVDISIASVIKVTGEGALAGVYEIFNQSGQSLDADDIKNAENQIKIEQTLAKESSLTNEQISRLITEFNLAIVNSLDNKDSLDDKEVTDLIHTILKNNQFDLTEKAIQLLVKHGIAFSQSDVAKDPETKKALEETMKKYAEMADVFSKEITIENTTFKIDDAYIIPEEDPDNFSGKPLISIVYTVSLNDKATPANAELLWYQYVNVLQDNSSDVINTLNSSFYFVEEFKDAQIQEIKPGGSNQYMMTYELSDLTTPITLKFSKDAWSPSNKGEELTFDITHLTHKE